MRGERGEVEPLRARLRRAFCGVTGTHSRIELQSGREMIVQGCCGIEAYEPCRIVLRVRDPELRFLLIVGEELLCSSYHIDALEISGKIFGVRLCREAETWDE